MMEDHFSVLFLVVNDPQEEQTKGDREIQSWQERSRDTHLTLAYRISFLVDAFSMLQ
jgi:hypothetical protein